MTVAESDQLRVWGRYDGYYLSILWVLSFIALMNATFFQPLLLVNELLILITPFFVYQRIRRFRDEGRGGFITFRRALGFLMWMFINACLILGFTQYFYLRDWDKGHQLIRLITPMLSTPEYEAVLRQAGMTADEYLVELSNISPLSFSCTCFVMNMVVCGLLSLFLAAIVAKPQPVTDNQQQVTE